MAMSKRWSRGVRYGQNIYGRSHKKKRDGRTQTRAALPDAGEKRQDGTRAYCQNKSTKRGCRIADPFGGFRPKKPRD
jgi:hypothetical protein